ncbi:MAG: magnesium transporter [Flavobacteriales bacterium]
MNREELINKDPHGIADALEGMNPRERTVAFLLLPGALQAAVFTFLEKDLQAELLKGLGNREIAEVLENMSPDDRTEFFEDFPDQLIKDVINLLSVAERQVALTLIGYREDSVGRIMTPYYIQARKSWTVSRTLKHVKKYGRKAETLNFIYIVDGDQKLIDDIKIGKLLLADDNAKLESLMDFKFVAVSTLQTREEATTVFEKYDRAALPVISGSGVLVGIVTFDDMLDEIEKRDTEDIQKFGGLAALEMPYVKTSPLKMVQKRAGWLVILFLSEMLTTSAMGYFEDEIERYLVLTLFIPLIISSGGNSGSQAATLIIRAMALNEVSLRDWWFVMRKEVLSGLLLGSLLGFMGFIRIAIWQKSGLHDYGSHWTLVGLTVGVSLVGIVLWGTLTGSMVPFVLKKLKLDPATSSAPFVATLVDVTGLVIYFTIAALFLSGELL